VAAAALLAFLSACDSNEARTADENFESDSGTKEGTKEQPSQGRKDASTDSGESAVETGGGGAKCGDTTCGKNATCEDDKCVCADGYKDVEEDGSKCEDIDECKERTAECSRGSVCKNKPGGYDCECNGPAYEKDGDECACAEGYERNDAGLCVGDDGLACADGIDCKNGHCEGKICCAVSCGEPGICQTAEGASCTKDGKKCTYPTAEDGESCDDGQACFQDGTCEKGKCQKSTKPTNCDDKNPCTDDSCEEPSGCRNANNTGACDDDNACTSDDVCLGGRCGGTEKDCSASADTCNVGACDRETGECGQAPRKTSAVCDDADPCTTGDACDEGKCVGATPACGANSTSCTAGADGAPNECACAEGFVPFEARCVPMNDECQVENPCAADADCIDPSNDAGDLTCECRPGFTGDGRECVASDPCATNPCGEGGTCTNGTGGTYTCECGAGLREIDGKCGCDFTGTFGLRSTTTISWQNLTGVEDGVVQTQTFVLHRQSYDAEGNLRIEITECGGSTFDLCSDGSPLVGREAYGQYTPKDVWGSASMPRTTITMTLPDSAVGGAFKSEEFAMVNGIKLDDPMGEWPRNRSQVAGAEGSSGTSVNGATWLDSDNDGKPGLTTFGVGPEGAPITGDPLTDPPVAYGRTSAECPRGGDGERYAYAYPPALEGIRTRRITKLYAAQRAILAYDGTIDSCDAVSGTITGPNNGQFSMDTRIGGCVRQEGSDLNVNCASAAINFLDQQPQTQEISDSKFKMRRMAEGVTCADVLAANYE
jgi:hypothetical protein